MSFRYWTLIFIASSFSYSHGWFPGMHVLGLRLTTRSGRAPGLRLGFLRVAAGVLSVLPFGIDYWPARKDVDGQTCHDLLLGTYVQQPRKTPPASVGPSA